MDARVKCFQNLCEQGSSRVIEVAQTSLNEAFQGREILESELLQRPGLFISKPLIRLRNLSEQIDPRYNLIFEVLLNHFAESWPGILFANDGEHYLFEEADCLWIGLNHVV